MTVLSKREAELLLAGLAIPDRCDCCSDTGSLTEHAYGPFKAYLCETCSPKLALAALQKAGRG